MIRRAVLVPLILLGAAACGQGKTRDTPIVSVNGAMSASGGENVSISDGNPHRIARRVTAAEVDAIEIRIKMPAGASPLASYGRYYTYVVMDGHRLIEGYLVAKPFARPGRYLNSAGPGIDDGGCSVITVYYDPERQHIAGTFCNGVA